ncbi:hypothetical protein TNCV_1547251 [Trichonephila clavipes]|nr:hypothetical protein TNCV_1547251 [Trichonephila clavipes]
MLRRTSYGACCSVLVSVAPNTVFEQDNDRSHIAWQTFKSLTGFDIFPWPANSPDMSSIEHFWDLIGRAMNRGPLAQTGDDQRASVNVAVQRLPQTNLNGQNDRRLRLIDVCIAAEFGILDTE